MTKRINSLGDLTPDRANARLHGPRNVGLIVDALHRVGAARSIVIDEDGVVLAGNATIDAAAEAGIERVHVVDADGETLVAVRRTGLTPEQKRQLAYFDNRAAELADWNLEQIVADLAADTDLSAVFYDDELEKLLDGLTDDADEKPETDGEPRYVTCPTCGSEFVPNDV
jgi:hypothetical protein